MPHKYRPTSMRNAFLVFLLFLAASCSTAKFQVTEENFFVDNFALEKGYVQYVETANDTSLALPVTERFRQNCQTAQKNAAERFVKEKNASKVETIRLGEYFERQGACRVRIAFKG